MPKILTYFAVQAKDEEKDGRVTEAVMRAAHAQGVLFNRLELLGRLQIGSTNFLRFRTDAENVLKILNGLDGTRATILRQDKGYQVRMADRQVPVASGSMHLAPLPGYPILYKGTKFVWWEHQFQGV